jgi:hypothetical protein
MNCEDQEEQLFEENKALFSFKLNVQKLNGA